VSDAQVMRAYLVDPSLFTAPYDAALTEGLVAAGVQPTWAVRPVRRGDRQEIEPQYVDDFFYRRVDDADWLPSALRAGAKGIAHAYGLGQLARRVASSRPDVVHFQWTVAPLLDALTMRILRRTCPVVLTVHDTSPFNGDSVSLMQHLGFDSPIKLADHVIVHTQAGRAALLSRGIPSARLTVIPHGPLTLRATPSAPPSQLRPDGRFTFLLFGEIKHYKGIDVLIEALGLLPEAVRAQARFIVAGRPRMDLAPLHARSAELGLERVFEVRPHRHSEQEMADLFAQADCFLFPYRQIDASGVYFLVKALDKWLIASRVGVFAEELEDGTRGKLIAPEDARALSEAIASAIAERPRLGPHPAGDAWTAIGRATRKAYRQARARHGR
jgi:glycosyltransferase involved in cell wall biosynthesis